MIRIVGIFLALLGAVNAAQTHINVRENRFNDQSPRQRTDLFQFPNKEDMLKLLDKQFDGECFPGVFCHQDKKILELIESYSGQFVNQEAIAFFIKSLKPYLEKNLKDRAEDLPTKMSRGIDHEILKIQDNIFKYFFEKIRQSNPNIDAYKYFVTVIKITHNQSLELLKSKSYITDSISPAKY